MDADGGKWREKRGDEQVSGPLSSRERRVKEEKSREGTRVEEWKVGLYALR